MDFVTLKGDCPNCTRASGFKQVVHQRIWPDAQPYNQSSTVIPEGSVWVDLRVYRCWYCNKSVVYREQWVALAPKEGTGERDTHLVHRERVYPAQTARDLHEAVPAKIRDLYREASKCEQAGAMRGAGVLYRAAVEELVKDQGATGKDLHKKIEDLKTKGLDEMVVDDLHEARLVGNDSIHAGITYSAEEVADVADLIAEATVTLYVQPAEKRRLREARQARRDAAKKPAAAKEGMTLQEIIDRQDEIADRFEE